MSALGGRLVTAKMDPPPRMLLASAKMFNYLKAKVNDPATLIIDIVIVLRAGSL
jgi:hypothetical protein